MSDETMRIEVTEGPDRGSHWTVPADVGKQAIKDGWARDAMVQPGDVVEVTPEKRDKAIAAAIKAARKLRGELDEDEKPAPKAEALVEPDEDDEEDEDKSGEYQTTDMRPAKRLPGRSRK